MAQHRPRLVIVDDDKTVVMILSDILREAGYDVTPYRTAEDALTSHWNDPADRVITALLLPRMNGFDLVRELRVLPWAKKVPVVAISALQWGDDQVRDFLAKTSPSRLLKKPFKAASLIELVGRMIKAPENVAVTEETIGSERG
jgi:DNA-binding response OmpR family regulator